MRHSIRLLVASVILFVGCAAGLFAGNTAFASSMTAAHNTAIAGNASHATAEHKGEVEAFGKVEFLAPHVYALKVGAITKDWSPPGEIKLRVIVKVDGVEVVRFTESCHHDTKCILRPVTNTLPGLTGTWEVIAIAEGPAGTVRATKKGIWGD